MFFKKKSNIIFRDYEHFGYITDNRNFSYNINNQDGNYIGDKILSEVGRLFYSVLEDQPRDINYLSHKIKDIFADVEIEIIRDDLIEFYNILAHDSFISSGISEQECSENDSQFKYSNQNNNTINYVTSYSSNNLDTQAFFEKHFNNKPQLTNVHIEITSRCNERCIHCYIPHNNKLYDIDLELFYKILNECMNMNVLHLTISGGEPMLHSNFREILRKCYELNFSINILSNLTLLDENIVEDFKINPLIGVQVSLYSMNPEIHDEITKIKGSFEKTKKGIEVLIENNIPLQISCPVMRANKNCYNDVKNWASKFGIQVISDFVIIGKYDNTIDNLQNRLSLCEVKCFINQNSLKNPSYFDDIKKNVESKKESNINDFVCSVCQSSICINEIGDVYPCAGWQNYIIGNVSNDSLNSIWSNSSKIDYLRNLKRKDFPKCINCNDRDYCTMCMVRNANEDMNGNFLNVNEYYCNVAKLYKEIILESKKG